MKRYFLILAMLCLVTFCGCNNSTHRNDIPHNEIHYTSSDGKIIEPNWNDFGKGVSIVTNVYENGKGIITCNGDITAIGEYAFLYCRKLTSITIPDSVTSIGAGAFEDCWNLTSITIPDSVTSIENMAFKNCTKLTSIAIPNSVASIGDWAFANCKGLTSITIPGSVATIGWFAFSQCHNLTSVTIGNNVTSIGTGAFANCKGLTTFYGKFASEDNRCLIIDGTINSFAIGCGLSSYTITDGVAAIGGHAFEDCESLTSITIPDSVTSIGTGAFEDCTSLIGITIPDRVTIIEDKAFYKCESLTSIDCKAVTPPSLAVLYILSDAFDYTNNALIFVPEGSVEAYKTHKDWSKYADRIIGYNF